MKTRDEILKDELSDNLWTFISTYPVAYKSDKMLKDWIIEAMEEYASQQQVRRDKIIEILPKLEKGDKIKLYGKETIVKGFDVHWNDALNPPQYEIILLTTGRGDPFYRSLDKIELTEQDEESKTRVFGGKDDVSFWSDKPMQPGHPDYEQLQPEQDEDNALDKWWRELTKRQIDFILLKIG